MGKLKILVTGSKGLICEWNLINNRFILDNIVLNNSEYHWQNPLKNIHNAVEKFYNKQNVRNPFVYISENRTDTLLLSH